MSGKPWFWYFFRDVHHEAEVRANQLVPRRRVAFGSGNRSLVFFFPRQKWYIIDFFQVRGKDILFVA